MKRYTITTSTKDSYDMYTKVELEQLLEAVANNVFIDFQLRNGTKIAIKTMHIVSIEMRK